ncbi:hypothetical protein PV797_04430 [Clostridiaceae bacterium M8S5]|nr:hypothetical protein PV797_04430 [Clostridiaceae bacterium M8S5]
MNSFGFIGTYKCDILNYLSRIFKSLGKNVVVIDASLKQEMVSCLPWSFNLDYVSFRNVDFYTHCYSKTNYNKVPIDDYDIVLIDYGFNDSLIGEIGDIKSLFIVSDFQRFNVLHMKELIADISGKPQSVRIYRDVVKSKINSKYIDNLLKLDEFVDTIAKYEFDLSYEDYKTNIEFQYNDVFKFKKLTKEYKEMFKDIISQYYQFEKKQIDKALKLAEGGN